MNDNVLAVSFRDCIKGPIGVALTGLSFLFALVLTPVLSPFAVLIFLVMAYWPSRSTTFGGYDENLR